MHLNNYACGCVTVDSLVAALQNCKNQVKISNNNRVEVLFSFQFVSLLLQRFLHFLSFSHRKNMLERDIFHPQNDQAQTQLSKSMRNIYVSTWSVTNDTVSHPSLTSSHNGDTTERHLQQLPIRGFFFNPNYFKALKRNIHLTTTKQQPRFEIRFKTTRGLLSYLKIHNYKYIAVC